MSDLDDLFAVRSGTGKPWLETISGDCRQLLEKVAVLIGEYGREPTWADLYRKIEAEFPADLPRTETTVRVTVRRLVKNGE